METDFDAMLAKALRPPGTPVALQARVMAAVARGGAQDIEQMRTAMRNEHGWSLRALQHRFWRQLAEAFVLIVCMFLPARFGVHALSTWLAGLAGGSSPVPATLLPLSLAAVILIGLLLVGRHAARASVRSAG